jgi:hypothetical protein
MGWPPLTALWAINNAAFMASDASTHGGEMLVADWLWARAAESSELEAIFVQRSIAVNVRGSAAWSTYRWFCLPVDASAVQQRSH